MSDMQWGVKKKSPSLCYVWLLKTWGSDRMGWKKRGTVDEMQFPRNQKKKSCETGQIIVRLNCILQLEKAHPYVESDAQADIAM